MLPRIVPSRKVEATEIYSVAATSQWMLWMFLCEKDRKGPSRMELLVRIPLRRTAIAWTGVRDQVLGHRRYHHSQLQQLFVELHLKVNMIDQITKHQE